MCYQKLFKKDKQNRLLEVETQHGIDINRLLSSKGTHMTRQLSVYII